MPGREITLSVVSHGQNALVNQLLADVQRHGAGSVSLVLTENIPDPVSLAAGSLSCPAEIVRNDHARGFGANHNAAFGRSRSRFFCVANPDIRLASDPFGRLVQTAHDTAAGVVGPLVREPAGGIADSARRFPTAGLLLRKLLGSVPPLDYPVDRGPVDADWVAGMFMLFASDAYRLVRGFDEAYFLYYEDVDICHRLHAAGRKVIFDPGAEVTHDARRASRSNPRLALRHAASALRFLARASRR